MKANRFLGLLAASLLLVSLSCNSTANSAPATLPSATSPDLSDRVSAARMTKDVYYLASDDLQGRLVGTPELDSAADYLADRFKSLGLRPLPGYADYFQRFSMGRALSLNPATSLTCADHVFRAMTDFVPIGFSADGEFSGDVAFIGYGLSDKAHGYDDYAGQDVKGKVVMLFRFEPHDEKGAGRFGTDDWSPAAAIDKKAEIAAAHGAAAVLVVKPPKYHDADSFIPLRSAGASAAIPVIQISEPVAQGLLRRGKINQTLAELQTAMDTTVTPRSFALSGVSISGNIQIERKRIDVKNVIAVLPGGAHPDEFIVVGAHYDHLGHGGFGSLAPGSTAIHNGADDNASGTAVVLALAERLVHAGRRDRSIIFAFFTGEEEGLIGSQYFVGHPAVDLDSIIAMLNLDMVGRVRNEMLYVAGSGTAAAFDPLLRAADASSPLQLKSIGLGGRGPSDHQSFAMKKIPVLFLFSGMHPDYHTPRDDADKVNYRGMSAVVDLSADILDRLARMPRQQYVSTFDNVISPLSGSDERGIRASLGVVPDYTSDESTAGVRITGTTPGSPADLAGLRDGDVIVQIGEIKIQNLYDLTEFLAGAKPGDRVNITIERSKRRVELIAKLVERKS